MSSKMLPNPDSNPPNPSKPRPGPAAPNRSYLEVHGFGLDRYIQQPMELRDGKAIASERPGHGVAFDWAALEGTRPG
jgi:L-alanine-DL-glutamate epimerase-like enolase superfamily enzyme